jgi:hypothetical protein
LRLLDDIGNVRAYMLTRLRREMVDESSLVIKLA